MGGLRNLREHITSNLRKGEKWLSEDLFRGSLPLFVAAFVGLDWWRERQHPKQ